MIYKLYGATCTITEPGTFCIANPVFIREFKNSQRKYYRRVNKEFQEISIKKYKMLEIGNPQSVDNKNGKILVILNPECNKTRKGKFSRDKSEIFVRDTNSDDCFWVPDQITVAIRMLDGFTCINKDNADLSEMKKLFF